MRNGRYYLLIEEVLVLAGLTLDEIVSRVHHTTAEEGAGLTFLEKFSDVVLEVAIKHEDHPESNLIPAYLHPLRMYMRKLEPLTTAHPTLRRVMRHSKGVKRFPQPTAVHMNAAGKYQYGLIRTSRLLGAACHTMAPDIRRLKSAIYADSPAHTGPSLALWAQRPESRSLGPSPRFHQRYSLPLTLVKAEIPIQFALGGFSPSGHHFGSQGSTHLRSVYAIHTYAVRVNTPELIRSFKHIRGPLTNTAALYLTFQRELVV